MCICHLFYWNRDVRKLYLFDVEFYRLLFRAMLISYNFNLAHVVNVSSGLHSSCHEDLSAILFILLSIVGYESKAVKAVRLGKIEA